MWCLISMALAQSPSDPPVVSGQADAAVVVGAPDWAAWLTTARGVPAEQVIRVEGESSRSADVVVQAAVDAAGRGGPDGVLWIVLVDREQAPLELAALLDATSVGVARTTVVVWDGCSAEPQSSPAETSAILLTGPEGGCTAAVPGLPGSVLSYLLLGSLYGWGDTDSDGFVTLAEAVTFAANTLDAVGVEHALDVQSLSTVGPISPATWVAPNPEGLFAALMANPAPEPEPEPVDPVTEMLQQIWWLRNAEEGRAQAVAYAGTLYAGVGTGRIVLGRTTLEGIGAGGTIDLDDPGCFVQGPMLPKRRGERIWPCGSLKLKHWANATDLYTTGFSAHVVASGEAVDHIESPPAMQAERIRTAVGRVSALRTGRGIEVGMPLLEALERMPVPPDDASRASVQWFDLGVQLLIEGDWVSQIRVWPVEGEPLP